MSYVVLATARPVLLFLFQAGSYCIAATPSALLQVFIIFVNGSSWQPPSSLSSSPSIGLATALILHLYSITRYVYIYLFISWRPPPFRFLLLPAFRSQPDNPMNPYPRYTVSAGIRVSLLISSRRNAGRAATVSIHKDTESETKTRRQGVYIAEVSQCYTLGGDDRVPER